MNRFNRVIVTAIIAITGFSANVLGEDHKGTNSTQPSSDENTAISAVESINMAGKLAAYARENHDAIELAAAARLLAANPPQPMPLDRNHQKENSGGKDAVAVAFTPDALLKEARGMARANPETLAAIDAIEKSIATVRGHPGGAFVDHDILLPDGGAMNYTVTFAGNQPMEVAVFANGPGAIDWHVFDENGNEVQSGSTDHFRITPKWTGPFKIKLANKTKTYIPYTLATN